MERCVQLLWHHKEHCTPGRQQLIGKVAWRHNLILNSEEQVASCRSMVLRLQFPGCHQSMPRQVKRLPAASTYKAQDGQQTFLMCHQAIAGQQSCHHLKGGLIHDPRIFRGCLSTTHEVYTVLCQCKVPASAESAPSHLKIRERATQALQISNQPLAL